MNLSKLMIRKSRNDLEYQENQALNTYQAKMKQEMQRSLISFNKNDWNDEPYSQLQALINDKNSSMHNSAFLCTQRGDAIDPYKVAKMLYM